MSYMQWQKSSFSTNGVECIELASSVESLYVRESDAPGTLLVASPKALRALLSRVREGRFDYLS
jgi:Domain of unknown function (DUF397)